MRHFEKDRESPHGKRRAAMHHPLHCTTVTMAGLSDLPQELLLRITAYLTQQEGLEFHLLRKSLYSALPIPIPRAISLKGHVHAMLLLLCVPSLQPKDEEFGWPVFMEVETMHPHKVVKIAKQSKGVVCVRTEPVGDMCFLREEQLFRKLAFCQDTVQGASFVIGEEKGLSHSRLQPYVYTMGKILKALPVQYSGEIVVHTKLGLEDITLRKVMFQANTFYFESRTPMASGTSCYIRATMPDLYRSLPASACELSLVLKEDMYTPYL